MGRRSFTRACAIVLVLAVSVPGAESGDDELDLDEFLEQEEIESLAPIADEEFGNEAYFGDVSPSVDGAFLDDEELLGCDECGDLWVDDCGGCPTRAPAFCPWIWGYVKTDYLMWWTKGMRIPPLVTTSRDFVSRDEAGVLGQPGTDVIFGGSRILKEERSGGRLVVGAWRDPCHSFGVEGDYISLGTVGTHFAAFSDGDPILARPFYNVLTEEQDSEITAYPEVAEGSVGVDAIGRFTSAGVRLRWNKCCEPICFELDGWRPETFRGHRRWGFLMGYRYVRMDENLAIREKLSSTDTELPTDFDILDVFDTENSFHGGELGVSYEAQYNRWSVEMLGKIAFGNSHEVVYIDGSTDIAIQNTDLVDSYSGGILAQRTNMGTYSKDRFAVVPEASATLGYQLARGLRMTVGYTFIFLSHVARPGDQIDLALNPNLFPPEEEPFSGPLRPAFTFQDSRFWAQGISFGLDYRW